MTVHKPLGDCGKMSARLSGNRCARVALPVSLLVLSACTHIQSVQQLEIVIAPASAFCLSPLADGKTRIVVVNNSQQKVAFDVYGDDGPPYDLFPEAFDLLAASEPSDEFSSWALVLEHFIPPDHIVRLGPGDRAEFVVSQGAWPAHDSRQVFKFEVRDTDWRAYPSAILRMCPSNGVSDRRD
ncbi:hypothetical protein [Marilutibacter maris]|uniref:hypothetical protein n=1 Tax=Marilutibacter maris TaxID=1605891 RepID=UPI0011AE4144|nr:hypothetical protein [Lysobacter maris]